MRNCSLRVVTFALLGATASFSQTTIPINSVPSRIVGHPSSEQNTVNSFNPNLVDGRELYAPQGIAVDTSVSPPILYVADTSNNRVLAWKNSTGFTNGQPADLIIGQQDCYHTKPLGPGTAYTTYLNLPTGLAVWNGDLYVADSGNNRILRFRQPFVNSANLFPDLYVGQRDLNSRTANFTGKTDQTGVAFTIGQVAYQVGLAFDSKGNLWSSDPGNRRVLRFDASDVAAGGGPLRASVVIGQQNFTDLQPVPTAANSTDPKYLAIPSAVAFDPAGNLYVADSDAKSYGRVLVFAGPNFANFMAAAKVMGVFPQGTQLSTTEPWYKSIMASPSAIFFVPSASKMGVVDQGYNRILLFDTFDKWDATISLPPAAKDLWGQLTWSNAGQNGATSDKGYIPAPSEITINQPGAAVFAGSELYIADTANHRVIAVPFQNGAFTSARAVLGQDLIDMSAPNLLEGREFFFSSYGSGNSAGIAIDTSGDTPHLYVADTYNNRVLGFKDSRQVDYRLKAADVVIGQVDLKHGLCNQSGDPNHLNATTLCNPTGLLVDSKGNLYVADSGNGRVLRFPAPFAQQGQIQADLVLGQHNFVTKITDPSAVTMAKPYGLTFAGTDGLAVSDIQQHRVLFFRFNNGGFDSATDNGRAAEKVFGQPDFTCPTTGCPYGSDGDSMNGPHGLASDSEGRIYVADTGNNRVLVFDQINNNQNGAQAALKISSLSQPLGVYVSQVTGEAWVTDFSSGQIKKCPKFQTLLLTPSCTAVAQAAGNTLAVTQDQYGDLIVADSTNRLGFYFPGLQVVNNGNYIASYPLAPGMFAAICSPGSSCDPTKRINYLGSNTAVYTDDPNPIPMPSTLGDVQVLFNGNPAPLHYVSPGQVNFYVPMGAPTSGTADIVVMQKSTGRIYAAGSAQMGAYSPALLMSDYSGKTRQAIVVNADGTVNSPSNPAARGSWITIYATGQGFVPGAPADGMPAPSSPLLSTPLKPQVNFNGLFPEDYTRSANDPPAGQFVNFSGLAPGWVGLWQINAYIPGGVQPGALLGGNQVTLLIVMGSRPSDDPTQSGYYTTIAVK